MKLIEAEGLSSAKLAEIVSVQPSTISHLLSGRNRPNFEFISKLLKMFPGLNPHWIINGEGDMYNSEVSGINIPSDDIRQTPRPTIDDYKCEQDNVPCVEDEQKLNNSTDCDLFTSVNMASIYSDFECANDDDDNTKKEIEVSDNIVSSDNIPTDNPVNGSGYQAIADIGTDNIHQLVVLYEDGTFRAFKSRKY